MISRRISLPTTPSCISQTALSSRYRRFTVAVVDADVVLTLHIVFGSRLLVSPDSCFPLYPLVKTRHVTAVYDI
jgi:hypothetical protein